jgi:formate dehydrogenase subunit delta
MDHEKLVRMVNQIASFFRHEGEAKAVISVAQHLKDFWDPRMRKGIIQHVANGGAGLDGVALKAVQSLPPVALHQQPIG